MIGNILTELITDTITKSILHEAESSEARQAAKRLGLVYKGFGRYVHPNNPRKVVAKVINGKLTRINPKFQEPSYTGSEPKPSPTASKTKPVSTTVVNKGDKPEEIPNPYNSEKPNPLAKQTNTKWNPSDFEKKAIQKDRDISAELYKAKGPQVLSHIQNTINKYKRSGQEMAITAKMYTLRDNIMDMIPISDSHKVPLNMKSIYAQHKLKQIAYKTVDKYGSLEGAIEAAHKALIDPKSSANKPLIKKIFDILAADRNILRGNWGHLDHNDEPIDNATVKKTFGI